MPAKLQVFIKGGPAGLPYFHLPFVDTEIVRFDESRGQLSGIERVLNCADPALGWDADVDIERVVFKANGKSLVLSDGADFKSEAGVFIWRLIADGYIPPKLLKATPTVLRLTLPAKRWFFELLDAHSLVANMVMSF